MPAKKPEPTLQEGSTTITVRPRVKELANRLSAMMSLAEGKRVTVYQAVERAIEEALIRREPRK